MSALRTHDVVLGAHTLHVHEVGDAALPSILWLHGSGPGVSALSNWESLITTMPGYRHVAPDVLGFGDSSHPADPPRGMGAFTPLRAAVTIELLEKLGITKTHVVGNSMGGMIALRMLQQAPALFDRVILMGSGGAPVPPTPALIQMIGFYADPTPQGMKALLQKFMFDTSIFEGRIDEIAIRRAAVATRPDVRRSHEATFDMASGPPKPFSPEELSALTHEVLVIHGRDDQVIPVEASLYFEKHLPNAQLHVLPHAGHWVQIEQVARFRAQASAFFSEKTATSSG